MELRARKSNLTRYKWISTAFIVIHFPLKDVQTNQTDVDLWRRFVRSAAACWAGQSWPIHGPWLCKCLAGPNTLQMDCLWFYVLDWCSGSVPVKIQVFSSRFCCFHLLLTRWQFWVVALLHWPTLNICSWSKSFANEFFSVVGHKMLFWESVEENSSLFVSFLLD